MTSLRSASCSAVTASPTLSLGSRQQAVEKSLKAALAANNIEFPHTHDLEGLAELCESSGLAVPPALTGVEALAPFGVQFRYGALEAPRLDRAAAARWSEAAIEWASEAGRIH